MDSMTNSDNASSPFLTEDAYAPSRLQGTWCSVCFSERCRYPIVTPHTPGTYGWVPFCDCPSCLNMKMKFFPGNQTVYNHALASTTHAIAQHDIWTRRQEAEQHRANSQAVQQQLGPREFTLTYGDHFADEEEAKRVMTRAIDRLTRYYKDEIIEFHAIGEYTKAGRPHIHGWYHLEGGLKITDKNFKRAYPPWNPKKKLGRGHEGGHHATIARVSDFYGYTEKHLEEAWLNVNITNDADDTASAPPASGVLEG